MPTTALAGTSRLNPGTESGAVAGCAASAGGEACSVCFPAVLPFRWALRFDCENFSGTGVAAVGVDDATFGDFAAVAARLLAEVLPEALTSGPTAFFGSLGVTTSLVLALVAAVAAGGRTAFRVAAFATTRVAGSGAATGGAFADGRRALSDAGLTGVAADFWVVFVTGTAAVFADFFVVNL